jgi:hypothetical protein
MRPNTEAILLFHGGAFCHNNLSVKGAPLSGRLFSTGSKLSFQPSKGVHESPQGHLWNPDVATDGLQEVSLVGGWEARIGGCSAVVGGTGAVEAVCGRLLQMENL